MPKPQPASTQTRIFRALFPALGATTALATMGGVAVLAAAAAAAMAMMS